MLSRFMEELVNILLIRRFRMNLLAQKLNDALSAEITEEGFKLLLKGMALFALIDSDFRKNLKDFNGRYLFKTIDGPINVAVTCRNGKMSVYEKTLEHYNVRVDFKDYKAVVDFLTDPDLDVLDQMLNQKLKFSGNLNYLYKFGYMARHLMVQLGIAA
ncbi:MAG: hypothetical protein JXX14_16240 [Deltaproteobacteria bacterium]|nr:hypothetical protein [Deltaproteobacteria bacterium]